MVAPPWTVAVLWPLCRLASVFSLQNPTKSAGQVSRWDSSSPGHSGPSVRCDDSEMKLVIGAVETAARKVTAPLPEEPPNAPSTSHANAVPMLLQHDFTQVAKAAVCFWPPFYPLSLISFKHFIFPTTTSKEQNLCFWRHIFFSPLHTVPSIVYLHGCRMKAYVVSLIWQSHWKVLTNVPA